jgi:hypothetical protein
MRPFAPRHAANTLALTHLHVITYQWHRSTPVQGDDTSEETYKAQKESSNSFASELGIYVDSQLKTRQELLHDPSSTQTHR